MGRAHILYHMSLKEALERVGEILRTTELGDGSAELALLDSDMLPEGYNGVMNAVLDEDGDIIAFKRDEDT